MSSRKGYRNGDELELSHEQGELMNAGAKAALDTLYETGEFIPTLYLHDAEEITFFNVQVGDLNELRDLCQQVLQSQETESVAYALFFNGTVEIDGEAVDALLMETGDLEDDTAHMLARKYSREKCSAGPWTFLCKAPHLLK